MLNMAELSIHSRQQKHTYNFLFIRKHYEMILAIIAGLLILSGWLLEHLTDHSQWFIFLLAYIIGGYAKAKEGWEETVHERKLNVELLMILAAIGAACIGNWQEGAVLIFIFALSGALESYATARSSHALSELLAYKPETARLILNGSETLVPVEQLTIGDKIRVKPGERVSADGTIIKGETTVDQSTITGESVPVYLKTGEDMMAGTMNIEGSVVVRVNKRSHETVFSRILQMVQTAQEEKVPAQQFIEKVEPHYVKAVLLFTAIMLVAPPFIMDWTWHLTFYRAMILLVVTSPCALVASTMPAVLSAIAFGARQGILVKGGGHLELFSSINAIAFDKTGTLTVGRPEVTRVHVEPSTDIQSFLAIAGSIEHESTHPLASAIVRYAETQLGHKAWETALQIQTKPGFGVSGIINGISYKVGKAAYIGEEIIETFLQDTVKRPETDQTVVYVATKDKVLGYFALRDQMRKEAQEAINTLNHHGIATIMLTGDNERTAQAIAQEAGVTDAISNCLPDNKVTHIKALQKKHGKVAMIGDGINDTPALATADIGIAMGGGTDAALEAADIVLVKNDLKKMVNLVHFSKKMNRIIKQNVIFALAMIAFLIVNTFLGDLSLTLGVIGHEGSTILVILNGLRLLRG
ncbi:heavy metal translocating P-type ATPase [Pullulanibacillus pueri]